MIIIHGVFLWQDIRLRCFIVFYQDQMLKYIIMFWCGLFCVWSFVVMGSRQDMLVATADIGWETRSVFSDISGHMYEDSVIYLQDRSIVQWYSDGTFGVDRTVTRAEMMKIVLEGKEYDNSLSTWSSVNRSQYQSCFDDVAQQWYAEYICYAASHNMVRGIGNNLFWPDRTISVAEWLKIAINAFGGMWVVEWNGTWWFQPFVQRAHQQWLLSKYALDPMSPMPRGQMAMLVHWLMLMRDGVVEVRHDSIPLTSSACGQPNPSTPPSLWTVNGVQRTAIVDVWKWYDWTKPSALVIARHGRTNSNTQLRSYIKLSQFVDDSSIVVYPLGQSSSRGWRYWSTTDDVVFFDTLVDELSQTYCIDPDQIYVVWHSMWASWTNWLACVRGDVIRGVGSVWWWVIDRNPLCSGSVDAMIMHHPDDNLASYAWGQAARDIMLAQNSCDPDSAQPFVWASTKSNCVQYTCTSEGSVVRCPHTESNTRGYYYPHTRPSFASSMIWDFWSDRR